MSPFFHLLKITIEYYFSPFRLSSSRVFLVFQLSLSKFQVLDTLLALIFTGRELARKVDVVGNV